MNNRLTDSRLCVNTETAIFDYCSTDELCTIYQIRDLPNFMRQLSTLKKQKNPCYIGSKTLA